MRPNPLQVLIEESASDSTREPAFLTGLLVAPLFVHLPLSDDSGRIRLVQFVRPDGLAVIPVFSDFDRAIGPLKEMCEWRPFRAGNCSRRRVAPR